MLKILEKVYCSHLVLHPKVSLCALSHIIIIIKEHYAKPREIKLLMLCSWLLCELFNSRKAVTDTALQKCPGNNIPIFKKDMAASKELEKLVSSIEERCCFEPAGFDAEGIKQHILDIFNERRRQLRRGHDYTLVSSIKKLWFFP